MKLCLDEIMAALLLFELDSVEVRADGAVLNAETRCEPLRSGVIQPAVEHFRRGLGNHEAGVVVTFHRLGVHLVYAGPKGSKATKVTASRVAAEAT